jgi:hypothetical protein
MDYTPEQIAFQLNRSRTASPVDFIRPDHVRAVMTFRKPVYGNYDVCGWPTREEQSRIQDLAQDDYYEMIAEADEVLLAAAGRFAPADPLRPRVEPNTAFDRADGYRSGMFAGYYRNADWDGMGQPWGEAYEAGCDFGRFWRLDDPRPIV